MNKPQTKNSKLNASPSCNNLLQPYQQNAERKALENTICYGSLVKSSCTRNVIVGSELACRPGHTDERSCSFLYPQPMPRLTAGLPHTQSFVIILMYKAYPNGMCQEHKPHSPPSFRSCPVRGHWLFCATYTSQVLFAPEIRTVRRSQVSRGHSGRNCFPKSVLDFAGRQHTGSKS